MRRKAVAMLCSVLTGILPLSGKWPNIDQICQVLLFCTALRMCAHTGLPGPPRAAPSSVPRHPVHGPERFRRHHSQPRQSTAGAVDCVFLRAVYDTGVGGIGQGVHHAHTGR
eukprot:2668108-Rhodomonas_salina.1